MSFSIGGAIGPLLGGIVLQHFWWGAVFLIAVPVMILLLLVGPTLLPEYRDPNAGKLDLLSAALSTAAVLLVIYGLKLIAQDGVSVSALGSVVGGLLIGVAFVRRQNQLADPLIDLRLFAIPTFRASLVLYGGAIFLLFGGFVYLPQYLQLVRGPSLRLLLFSRRKALRFDRAAHFIEAHQGKRVPIDVLEAREGAAPRKSVVRGCRSIGSVARPFVDDAAQAWCVSEANAPPTPLAVSGREVLGHEYHLCRAADEAIRARQADRSSPDCGNRGDQCGIVPAGENANHGVERSRVGDPQSVDEARLFAPCTHFGVNRASTAMHDDQRSAGGQAHECRCDGSHRRRIFQQFAAVRGSALYEEMRAGALSYRTFVARRLSAAAPGQRG